MENKGYVHYKEPLESNFGLLVLALMMLSCGLMVILLSGYILVNIVLDIVVGKAHIGSIILVTSGSLFIAMLLFLIFLAFILFPLCMIKDVYHEFKLDENNEICIKYTLKKLKVDWSKVILRYLQESKRMILTIEVGNGHSNINKIYSEDENEFENLVYLANLHGVKIHNYKTC